MCICTPAIKTPWCGLGECLRPAETTVEKIGRLVDKAARHEQQAREHTKMAADCRQQADELAEKIVEPSPPTPAEIVAALRAGEILELQAIGALTEGDYRTVREARQLLAFAGRYDVAETER